ncbi:MAG: hypothetical protein LBD23_16805 [Oscillospiraceae bacterium]|jgi:hypothetical protein|nr:hypothetical protein [Oscillospiraceae bacterium]
MSQIAEYIKNIDINTISIAKNKTKKLARYGIQIAMLNKLLSNNLLTVKEYHKINEQLKKDYEIVNN